MNSMKIRLAALLLLLVMLFTVGCNELPAPSDGDDSTNTEESTTNPETDETTDSTTEETTDSATDETTDSITEETTDPATDETTEDTTTESATTETETDEPTPPARPAGEYRILVTSDMHYTNLGSGYYGVSRDTRLQAWVDGILEEHARSPFDLIIIAGDMSLDYWGWNGGGTYQRSGVSDTNIFIKKYVSQLPQDVPIIILPGNHELYTNEKWKSLTGNNRDESFVLGTNLFIMPDSFSGAVDPAYVGGGKNDSPYAPVDMDFIQGVVDAHPECDRIFLISHHFDLTKESEAFKTFLKTEKRIVGLFSGHSHAKSIKNLDGYGRLTLAQTGNFASSGDQNEANFSWGFRDIYITKELVASRYFIPANEFYVNGKLCSVEKKVTDTQVYN